MRVFKNKYSSFNKALYEEYCIIPIKDTSYVPQGVCQVDDKVIISCYDYNHTENSILIVCTRTTSKIVKLDAKIHTGGICYHKSTDSLFVTGTSSINNAYVNKYSAREVLDALEFSTIHVDKIFNVDSKGELYSSSAMKSSAGYITCYGNDLYVGNFIDYKVDGKSIIKKYRVLSNGDLSVTYDVLDNPYSNTQGMCIVNYKNNIYYLFSRSFGRKRNSLINISKLENDKFININSIVMPCMAEQINTYNNKIMLIFESCASVYAYNSIGVNNHVYLFSFEELLNCQDNFKCFCKGSGFFTRNKGIKMCYV